MPPRVARGPRSLTADRRQARPMALRGVSSQGARVAVADSRDIHARAPRRSVEAEPGKTGRRADSALVEREREAERALQAIAAELSERLAAGERRCAAARLPFGLRLTWSDEARTPAGSALLGQKEFARRARSRLHPSGDEDAEARLRIELVWLRRPGPREMPAAALLPSDLRGLWEQAASGESPSWERLRFLSPAREGP